VKLEDPSQLVSSFFGLTSNQALQFRKNLFKRIHEIVFHGKGGYDWHTVYNMPIWLRKFTFQEVNNFYKNQAEEIKKSQDKAKGVQNVLPADGKITPPKFKTPSKSSYK
jgi:hypothetical protein